MKKTLARVLPLLVVSLSIGAAFVSVGCSAPVDPTANRMDTAPVDPNYPAGPYGYIEGSTVEDYKFVGKAPVAGDYLNQPMRDLLLGEFHADTSVKALLIVGAAVWCGPCNQEAPGVDALAVEKHDQGLRALTLLAEGAVRGEPSTAQDVNEWADIHGFKQTSMGIDPAGRLFQYASLSAFPVQILIDTRSMKINWLCVGEAGAGGCDVDGSVSALLGSP